MTDVVIDDMGVSGEAGGWPQIVPPPVPHPIALPGVDPVSGAVTAVTAEWMAVHAAMSGHRETLAGKYTGSLTGTAAQLDTGDTDNAATINAIQEV